MIAAEKASPDLSGLKTRRDILELLWKRGLSGRALLQEHTQLIDSHLSQKFALCSTASEGMALIAVGGYGRSELFPFSDIDLLLLHDQAVAESNLASVTEAIFYPLWDAGLEVGHSVRTVKSCLADAKNDFFFQIALLDARFIAGQQPLLESLQASYTTLFIEGRRHHFLKEMTCHRNERHRRFGQHSYLLEPQIKESRGGLRDIQALLWTAKVIFGLKDLAAVREAGLLSDQEYHSFEKAWDHLIKIRNRLHYISTRKNDQLYFEHQEEIAKAFHYRNTKGIKGVEHFMREVYGHFRTIAVTTDLFFEHADEVLRKDKPWARLSHQTLEKGITARKGKITITSPNLLKNNPELLIRLFVHSARTGLPIHHQARKLVTANLHFFKETAAQLPQAICRALLEILQRDKAPQVVLETMLECGLLEAIIPEFTHLTSLAQHDIYHVYTVDHHLIQTVIVLHQIIDDHKNIYSLIPEPSLLFLAALLHDIGKGYGSEHSRTGARLATEIGTRLGLTQNALELLEFLVANHLFLTDTALKRDLEDAALIARCAEKIKTPERLAMLFLLSIADARATGPTVWNDWKGALLFDLYLRVALWLDKSEKESTNLSLGIEWIRDQVSASFAGKSPVDLATLPDDYLLGFSPEEISGHIILARARTQAAKDLIITPVDKKSYWSLLIITKDRPGLLAMICGTIAIHNLEVLAAQIFTWPDGTALDRIDVRPLFADSHDSFDWHALSSDLTKAVNSRLGLDYRLNQKKKPSQPDRAQLIKPRTKVIIDNDSSEKYTVIEVHTENRSGIMYNISRCLTDFQINIYRAKISTRSDQVVDVFYVLDSCQQKIVEKSFIAEIQQSLIFAASF